MDLDDAFVASVVDDEIAVVDDEIADADDEIAAESSVAAAAVGDEMVDKEMVEVVHPHYYFFDS